jgi:hypothetical protein
MPSFSAIKHRPGLAVCLREIFDAAFWKQAHTAIEHEGTRWTLPLLTYTWIALGLSNERTLRDRFECARCWVVEIFEKLRRPGTTYQGFADASLVYAESLLQKLRQRMRVLATHWPKSSSYAWPIIALDGSRLRLPHTQANADEFGQTRIKGRADSAPQLLAVTAVALQTGLLQDWEIAGGNASEPELTAAIIKRLPPKALVVKDAGKVSYTWFKDLLGSGRHILMRVGANFKVWAEQLNATRREGGEVWLYPACTDGQPPLRLRLITVRVPRRKRKGAKQQRKRLFKTIYLLTDLSVAELSDREAGRLYRLRWHACEIGFRSFKQTLGHTTLLARTPEMALLECHFALLGLQILTLLTLRATPKTTSNRQSVAQAWRTWRKAVRWGLSYQTLLTLLATCTVDGYHRRRAKSRRRAPQQKRIHELSPPKLRRLTKEIKEQWTNAFGNYFDFNF